MMFGACKNNQTSTFAGYPDRSPDLDILPGFQNPPKGYGNVPFYWWVGDTLTKERLLWQMDQLEGMGLTGLQVNYCHTDTGGASYGLTYPSQPALFSEEWWSLFEWFLQEAKKRDMSVSLSDYTLGAAGQGWYVDEMLSENPELYGSKLEVKQIETNVENSLEVGVPENMVSAIAYKMINEEINTASAIDLLPNIKDTLLSWAVPGGDWRIFLVHRVIVKTSFDPMNPLSGPKVVEKFFQRFEDHCPGEAGKALNFFFSDELSFGIRGFLWNDSFATEFKKQKGYEIIPKLPHLFDNISSESYKIRLDYYDVMVELSEEGFFKPVYDWHTSQGMLFGCDHGGRGRDVTEFGDYFRTQRWMSGPGNDQPGLGRNIIKNKVASSIAHLYERPRTWLEGFYGSGWGTSSEELADAVFANYAMGHNLLSLHGLYYTTHGSWWEWAAPDNHFRQPYWTHAKDLMKCIERLSYVLSQGHHVCDVAMIYPVAPVQADLKGTESVNTSFAIAHDLYPAGIDFDFMDFQSLERCQVQDGALHVSGESYKVLILPAMSAVKYSTIEKALEFFRSGGIVIAVGALPEASERIGANDEQLQAMIKEMFGRTFNDPLDSATVYTQKSQAGGKGIVLMDPLETKKVISELFTPDFKIKNGSGEPYILHRKAGPRDLYFVYGVPKGTECFFRAKGKVELWNPWDATISELRVCSVSEEGTFLKLPWEETQPQLIVFSPGEASVSPKVKSIERIVERLQIDNIWEFEIEPTLDNKYGDFRLPAFDGKIGVEIWDMKFVSKQDMPDRWKTPDFDDSNWNPTRVSFGQQFWILGPLPDAADYTALETKLADLSDINPDEPVEVNGKKYFWQPYEFSWRWGLKDDAGHQGYHGLKGKVNNDIFSFGKINRGWRHMPSYPLEPDETGKVYYLWSTVGSEKIQKATICKDGLLPAKIWINNEIHDLDNSEAELYAGANPVLFKYENVGRGYVVFKQTADDKDFDKPVSLATDWYLNPAVLPYYYSPKESNEFGFYRFKAPPGVKAVYVASFTEPEVWVAGEKCNIEHSALENGRVPDPNVTVWKATLPQIQKPESTVAVKLKPLIGLHGGAAIPEPVVFDCGNGTIELGDLAQSEALKTYSGGMWYRKTVQLSSKQAEAEQVILDLGELVASAELYINGKPVGTKSVSPWRFDITGQVQPGNNQIEIVVFNTLGNNFLTTPSQYTGRVESGLMGPVRMEFLNN